MSKTDLYIELRDEFSKKLQIAQHNLELCAWKFYTNSSQENLEEYTQAQEEMSKLYNNEDLYKKFKNIQNEGLEDKHLSKQLKKLVRDFYDEIESGTELKELRDKENKIAAAYNSHVMILNGQPVTPANILLILESDMDVEFRKKAYTTLVSRGDVIADELVELVKMRNAFAKTKGYDNFFNYMIEDTYEISPQNLDKLLEGVYSRIQPASSAIEKERRQDLAQAFGIDENDLRDWHFGLLTGKDPSKEVTAQIKSNEQVEEIATKTYKSMGYDIENMGITLDLYPRENKNTHGFAFCIEPGEDARILANLTNNIRSLDTLLHELGHCVYDIGLDKNLPFLDRDCASPVMTEAIAMMMGDLPKTENILNDIVQKNILDEFKKELRKDEARFVGRSLQIIEFERELYKNPEQDLKTLWKKVKMKYLYRSENTELNNEWATIPHYLSHPGYYQNYFRAGLIKVQIYNAMTKLLGNITENTDSAKFLNEKLFKLGASKDEDEIVEMITGKPTSGDDFCARICN